MKKIPHSELIPMDVFVGREPIKIDLIYAQANHRRNIFEAAIYHDTARLWAHKDIAAITLLTAKNLNKEYGYNLEIQDCFRSFNAQEAMQKTEIAKANPEWMEEPDRLLAPAGAGGHPRGMAIDVRVLDKNGREVDMGTPFDHMDETSSRNYTGFSNEILNNRKILEHAFMDSAEKLGFPFLPLPSEWWDFRFPHNHYSKFEPINDENLPPQMQMTEQVSNNISDFPQEHFDKLATTILNVVDENL